MGGGAWLSPGTPPGLSCGRPKGGVRGAQDARGLSGQSPPGPESASGARKDGGKWEAGRRVWAGRRGRGVAEGADPRAPLARPKGFPRRFFSAHPSVLTTTGRFRLHSRRSFPPRQLLERAATRSGLVPRQRSSNRLFRWILAELGIALNAASVAERQALPSSAGPAQLFPKVGPGPPLPPGQRCWAMGSPPRLLTLRFPLGMLPQPVVRGQPRLLSC